MGSCNNAPNYSIKNYSVVFPALVNQQAHQKSPWKSQRKHTAYLTSQLQKPEMSRVYSHSSKAAVSINKTTFCTITIYNYNTVWTYTDVPGKSPSPGPTCTPLASSHKSLSELTFARDLPDDTRTRLTPGGHSHGPRGHCLEGPKDRGTDYGGTERRP